MYALWIRSRLWCDIITNFLNLTRRSLQRKILASITQCLSWKTLKIFANTIFSPNLVNHVHKEMQIWCWLTNGWNFSAIHEIMFVWSLIFGVKLLKISDYTKKSRITKKWTFVFFCFYGNTCLDRYTKFVSKRILLISM